MQNAYICHTSGAERFSLTFHYVNENLGVDRKFNLNRQSSETISVLLTRVQCNIQKVVHDVHAKKRRKVQKKKKAKEVNDGASDASDDSYLEAAPQVTVELLRKGNPVPSDETCQSLLQSTDFLTLSLTGKKYNVVVNPPWVDDIQLPKSILCNFPVYPSKFVGSNLDCAQSVYEWYKKPTTSGDWQKVGTGYMYSPSVADINYLLKVSEISLLLLAVNKNWGLNVLFLLLIFLHTLFAGYM